MTRRTAASTAWSLWAVSVLFLLVGLAFTIVNAKGPAPQPAGTEPLFEVFWTVILVTFPMVAVLVASRRPENPIGWILFGVSVPLSVSGAAHGYATFSLYTDPGSLPGAEVMAWLASWLFAPPLFALGPLLFLLFPDGRLLSKRWRPIAWLLAAGVVAAVVSAALMPGPLAEPPFEEVVNPFGLPGGRALLQVVNEIGWLALTFSLLGSALCIVLRFRRAVGVQRLQLKWMVSAAGLFALASITGAVTLVIGGHSYAQIAILLAFAGIPIAAGLAILRYRLYDIDVVINRTLVYGLLSAILGAAYLGLVALTQLVLQPLTPQTDLSIVVSTLAVAALFRPLRARVQSFIDRRFYRHKYDAAATLDGFSARLREQVDLESLRSEVVAVAGATMQPTHVSLWLRQGAGRV